MGGGAEQEKVGAWHLAFGVSSIAALRLAPKEDFTLNAKRSTQNCFMRRGWRVRVMDNRVEKGSPRPMCE
jgi:hypothetical protein